jgi:hypothetical protein
MRHVLVVLFVLGTLFLIAGASDASAAITVGSSLRERANLFTRCDSFCTELPVARPGGLPGAQIPADGVLTRWRIRAATRGWVRLRILRPQEDGSFAPVGASDPMQLTGYHAPGQDNRYEFPAQIPVRAGDVLALDHDRAAGAVFHGYGADLSYSAATFSPALGDGPATPGTPVAGRELLLNADVQLDGQEPSPPPTTTPPPPITGGDDGPIVPGEGGPTRPSGSAPTGHAGRPSVRPQPHVPHQRARRHRAGRPTRSAPPRRSEERTGGHRGAAPTRSDPPVQTKRGNAGHRAGTPQRSDPPASTPERPSRHDGSAPQRAQPAAPKAKRKRKHGGGTPQRQDPPPAPQEPTFVPH